jgi:hypothetical protein
MQKITRTSPAVNDRTTIHAVSVKSLSGFFNINGRFLKIRLSALTKGKKGFFLFCFVLFCFFQLQHRAQGFWKMDGGGCVDKELGVKLQLINVAQAKFLQIISSFYKAWSSTKHIIGSRWERKCRCFKDLAGSRQKMCNVEEV